MVRAILAGTKTQTRRIVKPERVLSAAQKRAAFTFSLDHARKDRVASRYAQQLLVPVRHPDDAGVAWDDCPMNRLWCPYGAPRDPELGYAGDTLWVRETWCPLRAGDYSPAPRRVRIGERNPNTIIAYRADHVTHEGDAGALPWRPSIHLPRWASRLTLTITSVRVERLQDITEEDAEAEGAERMLDATDEEVDAAEYPERELPATFRRGYRELWEAIHGAGSWALNSWVWAVAFTYPPTQKGRHA